MGITKSQKAQYALPEGPRAILRPPNNSFVAKAFIINWSQNLIWAYGTGVFGRTKKGKITRFA